MSVDNFSLLVTEYINSFNSPNSKLAYIRDIKQFQKWCLENDYDLPIDISKINAAQYRDFLSNTFAIKTVERKLSVIKGVFKLAVKTSRLSENPFYEIRPPENYNSKKKKNKPLDVSEVQRILLFPKLRTHEGMRDYTMIFLMFSMGLKIGEVVNVHFKDFSEVRGFTVLRIRKSLGKGYYSKIPQNCLEVVNDYIKKYKREEFLFTSLAKNKNKDPKTQLPLAARSGWAILKKYLHKAKLDIKGRTTNCAREFFINELAEEGESFVKLQEALGLNSLNAIKRYQVEESSGAKEKLSLKNHPVDKIKIEIRQY
ncbi:MAG: hypothetical protein COA79_10050 [Planctomycetota bacterium]|nr:MAG: hypothetical protein COA79_10050 [Planctomycetota bacterium]